MTGITSRVGSVLLLSLFAIPLCCGCGNRQEQQSPVAARRAQRESDIDKPQPRTTPVANKKERPEVEAKLRINRRTVESQPSKSESHTSRNPAKRPATGPPSTLTESTGTLTGRVLLSGKPPAARKITVTKDQDVCGLASGEVRDFVVSDDGGLKDVVVEILGIDPGEAGFEWTHPENGYVLRQKGCQFKPSLLVMPTGEDLTVFNDDPLGHNVNSGQWNEQQPGGGSPIVRPLSGTRPVRVGCNIHSWMEAWAYLARSPFCAVTDGQGNYQIENVPSGKYRVTYWHPGVRPIRERVTITAGKAERLEVSLKSPVRN